MQRYSANAPTMLARTGDLNGMALDDLLGERTAHRLRNALSASVDASHPAVLLDTPLPGGGPVADISIHQHDGSVIIEIEPSDEEAGEPLELARALISRIKDIKEVDTLVDQSARLIQGLLGYDRVMIYRFEDDGAGKVMSEVKRPGLESFLGQYFPATDIPQQARALYMRNTIRLISDSGNERVPILPEFDTRGMPLDLSFSHLRSVSPIHCEYLRNMGVGASMSISVIVEGRLWGLIACHHYSPRTLNTAQRLAAEMFGEFFSLHLQALKQRRRIDTATAARKDLDTFLRAASRRSDLDALFRERLSDFASLVPCDGVGLWMNGQWSAHDVTPPRSAVLGLIGHADKMCEGGIWHTHSLSGDLAEAADYFRDVSGVLVIPLSQVSPDYLLFFRKEFVQTLDWAGNPEKSYETGPLGDRLTPRKSFEIWKQTVERQSRPWTEADREIAEAARSALVDVILRHSELMAEEHEKADIRQRMLNEELNHRVKNILSVIKSLVGQPVQQGRSLQDYVNSLKGRIQALSVAHDQVVRGDGGGLLTNLLNAELSPYRAAAAGITLDGPSIWLEAEAFSVMALVLHELSTNAAKYGALSQAGGQLNISWQIGPDGTCTLTWQESGGPEVVPPSQNGFGSALIRRSIPYDLGGTSEVHYNPGGLRAELSLPGRHFSTTGSATEEPQKAPRRRIAEGPPRKQLGPETRVLLVEDQMLIAMDVEAMLEESGIGVIRTSGSVTEALKELGGFVPDIAILDVNLGADTSIPVAEELRKRNVPFVFATGYGDSAMIPSQFSSIPVVRKPYTGPTLTEALTDRLAGNEEGENAD